MYPEKDKAKLRGIMIDSQLDVLIKERDHINTIIQKLELERGILKGLLEIYELEKP